MSEERVVYEKRCRKYRDQKDIARSIQEIREQRDREIRSRGIASTVSIIALILILIVGYFS